MNEERRELYREGIVVDVEKTKRGYAISIKDGFVIEYFFSEKPLEKGKRVKVYCIYGKKHLKSKFELVPCD
ncbi:MAG: hypothetical protein N3F04_04965 [Candidatus Nezhaarchaeota archaeon]|nr:hypothetical protein [Candidatus Nezhaarchaeota archaeon]MCX8142101.1 hypothetical protein [Candidatus Nezhaarchaeota archaeon]MDW8050118.1 hypothetical protein [Nitrososphaerota archaeon]